MIVRFVRRPALPGETNHELVWPLVFIILSTAAYLFFYFGGVSPGCLFYKITTFPCLGCGATRCARELSHFNFWSAFKYHPGLFLILTFALIWTIYSIIFWISGSSLRVRLVIDESARQVLLITLVVAGLIHWLWQCFYLR
jgi:hypothetical protein